MWIENGGRGNERELTCTDDRPPRFFFLFAFIPSHLPNLLLDAIALSFLEREREKGGKGFLPERINSIANGANAVVEKVPSSSSSDHRV